MFLLFGAGKKQKVLKEGSFHCPLCRQDCNYELIQPQNYISLYFIPIFKKSSNAEILSCKNCDSLYRADRIFEDKKENESELNNNEESDSVIDNLNKSNDVALKYLPNKEVNGDKAFKYTGNN